MGPQQFTRIKWTARNAWQCWLALVLLNFIVITWLRFAQNHSASENWLMAHENFVQNVLMVFRAGLWLTVAYWLSRVHSIRDFVGGVGLNQPPNLFGWCGALIAIGIALADGFGVSKGWTSPNRVTRGMFSSGGESLIFYVLFAISIGPFFEEVVMRGFLYRAFRGSYQPPLTTFIILSATAWFHWSAVIHSLWTPACLFSLWTLLCVMRERTQSVWNCILCHAAYNAAGTLPWPSYVVGMILILPYCAYNKERVLEK